MTTQPVRLDIFSDFVCPWCLIGKANLDRALEGHPDHPFAIEWHPFRLNPTMPREGMAYMDYLRAKFGVEADKVLARVLHAARDAGIEIRVPEREPDTTDAHRLMYWAGLEGAQTRAMSGLLAAHWKEGRDIGDAATLADIGAKAGLDREMTLRLLASDADLDTVNTREAHARERGINSVPTFIIAERHVVPGAQPVGLWNQVIEEIAGFSA